MTHSTEDAPILPTGLSCLLCGRVNSDPRPWDKSSSICPDCEDREYLPTAPAVEGLTDDQVEAAHRAYCLVRNGCPQCVAEGKCGAVYLGWVDAMRAALATLPAEHQPDREVEGLKAENERLTAVLQAAQSDEALDRLVKMVLDLLGQRSVFERLAATACDQRDTANTRTARLVGLLEQATPYLRTRGRETRHLLDAIASELGEG